MKAAVRPVSQTPPRASIVSPFIIRIISDYFGLVFFLPFQKTCNRRHWSIMRCLIFIGCLARKSRIFIGYFHERALSLVALLQQATCIFKVFYASSPPSSVFNRMCSLLASEFLPYFYICTFQLQPIFCILCMYTYVYILSLSLSLSLHI